MSNIDKLLEVVSLGNIDEVKRLIDDGFYSTDYDNRAIQLDEENGHMEMVKYLVNL